MGIAAREGRTWQGDWASNFNWIRQDRMFAGIPTGGTVDFAFADLIPDTVIAGLTPRDFAGESTPGCSWAGCTTPSRWWPSGRSPAASLLACTFRLREHLDAHPVATTIMDDMIRHMTSTPRPA